jgi:cytochrome c-type biogenesis protein CcmH/NrfG
MFILYGLLLLMVVGAFTLLAIPYYQGKIRWALPASYWFIATGTALVAFTLYYFSGNHQALAFWFAEGKQHYELLGKIDELGGIDGVIFRIQEKLKQNPADAEGWFILGKLYLSKQNAVAAKEAFSKAHALKPDDVEISRYYRKP